MTREIIEVEYIDHRVRLHSSMWVQGYCDGEIIGYDFNRAVFSFRPDNARLDDPIYEVRLQNVTQFEFL
jgi:hypothetical protein